MKDGDNKLQIDINPGKERVEYIRSDDYNFQELTDDNPTRKEVQDVLEEKLGIETSGKTQIAGVFEDEFSIVLFEGSKVYAGKKWPEERRKLHPLQ